MALLVMPASRRRSTDNDKSAVSASSMAVHGEMGVKAGHSLDPKPEHDRKTCAIDQGEVLIRKNAADGPRRLKIRASHRLNHGHSSPQALPKAFRGVTPQPMAKEQPSLGQHMIGRDQIVLGRP